MRDKPKAIDVVSPWCFVNPGGKRAVLRFLVLDDGRVDVCLFQYRPDGGLRGLGQRIMVGPWSAALACMGSPSVRVVVRAERHEDPPGA